MQSSVPSIYYLENDSNLNLCIANTSGSLCQSYTPTPQTATQNLIKQVNYTIA